MNMSIYFKALQQAVGLASDLALAMSPESEEGSNLSQKEIVRIAVRGAFRMATAFGANISNANMSDQDFSNMLKEELQQVINES